jgi:hypothetical protein
VSAYEDAQRSFHALLETPSATFRLAELPFRGGGGGYEDWYLIDDWQALGELNAAAVDAVRGGEHDRAAALAADGWGSVYSLVRGPAAIPNGVDWLDKPRDESPRAFLDSLPHESVWRRQLVLGPAAEFCGSAPGSHARLCI